MVLKAQSLEVIRYTTLMWQKLTDTYMKPEFAEAVVVVVYIFKKKMSCHLDLG
jgi:hypothetical protein